MEVSTEKGYRELITECIRKDQAKTIGFEDQQMICADFKKISSPTKDEATWMELGEEVNLLRCIKTEEELEKVAKAEAIGDQAFQKILGDIKPGVTELTIAAKLDYYMRELGLKATVSIRSWHPDFILPCRMPYRPQKNWKRVIYHHGFRMPI